MTKEEIRENVRDKRRAMSNEEILAKSEEILDLLYTTKEYKDADVVFTYISYKQEVNTQGFIEKALADGKKVAVPKVLVSKESSETSMEFYYIDSLAQVERGYQGILEPKATHLAKLCDARCPLMIMPGLAFDKDGNRIGYGGGFYDKYLNRHIEKLPYLCALVFDFQMFDTIEAEAFDVPVDSIITPDEIVRSNLVYSKSMKG